MPRPAPPLTQHNSHLSSQSHPQLSWGHASLRPMSRYCGTCQNTFRSTASGSSASTAPCRNRRRRHASSAALTVIATAHTSRPQPGSNGTCHVRHAWRMPCLNVVATARTSRPQPGSSDTCHVRHGWGVVRDHRRHSAREQAPAWMPTSGTCHVRHAWRMPCLNVVRHWRTSRPQPGSNDTCHVRRD